MPSPRRELEEWVVLQSCGVEQEAEFSSRFTGFELRIWAGTMSLLASSLGGRLV